MNKYQLILSLNVDGFDDPSARQDARLALELLKRHVDVKSAKLQRVFDDRPPQGIKI